MHSDTENYPGSALQDLRLVPVGGFMDRFFVLATYPSSNFEVGSLPRSP